MIFPCRASMLHYIVLSMPLQTCICLSIQSNSDLLAVDVSSSDGEQHGV